MASKMRVLVFPAGSEIAAEVFDALRMQKDVELFGATSVRDHAEMLFRHLATGIPYLGDDGLIESLNEVIANWSIDFLWPARDDVQLFLTLHEADVACRVVTSPLETVEILRSKRLTYEALAGEDFIPHTFDNPTERDLPIFAKPSVGEGSKGAELVTELSRAREIAVSEQDFVLCEYLPGTAYTVDCFTGNNGKLLCCIPRTRDRVKAGISVRSEVIQDVMIRERVREIGERINARFEFRGVWFFQLKERSDGALILMEASPRVPGTMALTRVLGVNYPLLTLYLMRDVDIAVKWLDVPALLDKAFVSRFRLGLEYNTVYMDYDDTMTMGDTVNPLVMAFIYQCRNRGKRIVLLTRHDDEVLGELHEDMARRGIAETLFDRIVHLGLTESKSDFVTEQSSVFVDDSFSERVEIYRDCAIPVFGIDGIEALIDWRQ